MSEFPSHISELSYISVDSAEFVIQKYAGSSSGYELDAQALGRMTIEQPIMYDSLIFVAELVGQGKTESDNNPQRSLAFMRGAVMANEILETERGDDMPILCEEDFDRGIYAALLYLKSADEERVDMQDPDNHMALGALVDHCQSVCEQSEVVAPIIERYEDYLVPVRDQMYLRAGIGFILNATNNAFHERLEQEVEDFADLLATGEITPESFK